MALTDVFISPAGAGDNSGSSVANALPAISSGDWSTNIEGLDRANKRFVFLTGTYDCTTKLTFSGSAPTSTQPNQWVGADSSGNILRPKFQESGLFLDLTDYPLFVCSANTAMVDAEENTYYKCLSFENTNTSYSQIGVFESQTADVDQQHWVGCNFKCLARNTSAHCATITTAAYHDCVFQITDTARSEFDAVVKATTNVSLDNCRIIGPAGKGDGTVAAGGDQGGLYLTALTGRVRDCIIFNVKGQGIKQDSTSVKTDLDVANCTICKVGGSGVDATGASSQLPGKGSLQGCIIFDCGDHGIDANADDSRQSGAQILAMGSNTNGNFSNMDSYEDMIDVIAITTADFVDYDNDDFRIRRDSPLYKFYGTRNLGAVQNEDFEFASVS